MIKKWMRQAVLPKKVALALVCLSLMVGAGALTGCDLLAGDKSGHMDAKAPVTDIQKEAFRLKGNQLTVQVEPDLSLQVDWCRPDLVRAQYLKKGETPSDTLVLEDRRWDNQSFDYSLSAQKAVMKTAALQVTVDLEKRLVNYSKPDGTLIVEEQIGKTYNESVFNMTLGKADHYYGLHGYDAWENSSEGLTRDRGGIVKAGQQGNAGAPFLWTTAGYGLLLDSASGRMTIDSGVLNYVHNTPGGKDYFVLAGTPKEIFQNLAEVSGRAPLMPKWAMGFHHSEWGVDEAEMRQTASEYRKRGLMLDNYILDFDWKAWGEDHYGEFRWNATKFPNGPTGKLAKDLNGMGIHMSGILKPRIHVKTDQGAYATEHDFWWPKRMPSMDYFSKKLVNGLNFAKQEVRDWFYDHNKLMQASGFSGYWNDEADEGYDAFQHLNMQRALYEGQRRDSQTRVWSINRNFYLGAQRYAYSMWSGDVNSGFDSMKSQRERLLSAVSLGEAKWGMDTGGFNGPEPTPENYARWMQMSAFSPTFRVHGREFKQRQPWAFGPQAEQISKDVMNLRSKLLPYIYTYERIGFETGLGLVRPLVMEYPEDPKVANYVDGWLFGDNLYVAPVVDAGQTMKAIYLPKGQWIDYKTGKVYSGGQTLQYPVNAKTWEDIPLFIKAGAILPTQEPVQYVGEKVNQTLNLAVFPKNDGGASEWTWYDDDGTTYQYEEGTYLKQRFSVEKKGQEMIFQVDKAQGTYVSETQAFRVKLYGQSAEAVVIGKTKAQAVSKSSALTPAANFYLGKDVYGDYTELILPVGEALTVTLQE